MPLPRLRTLTTTLCAIALLAPGLRAADAPPQVPTWGQEPREADSATRATICLNGVWRFQPVAPLAEGASAPPPTAVPTESWGLARVPGVFAFKPHHAIRVEGLVSRGSGAVWNGLEKLDPLSDAWNRVDSGWYERPLAIPAEWAGRTIALDLRRVCTDATVFIDGKPVGAVGWPGGELALESAVQPGTTHRLAILVRASASGDTATEFMGTGANQTVVRKQRIESRGLVGDVLLHARPRGARVADVAVTTSTRNQRLTLNVELADIATATPVTCTARLLRPDGSVERTFSAASRLVAAAQQTITLGWDWADARLWDVEKPELYDLRLAITGNGINDEFPVTFGFREFWVAGRTLLLNGSEIRLRPGVLGNTLDELFGTQREIDAAIDGLRATGFNSQEFWPWDIDERGTAAWHDLWYERAMRKGWPVIANLATMAGVSGQWDQPGVRDGWIARMAPQVRRWRNNPAIIMWVHSPNLFTDWTDQDPRVAGHAEVMRAQGERGPRRMHNAAARDANELLRALDPTRPIINHAGSAAGDFQTVNFYPCLTQVQETEEWLSDWVTGGTGPYWPVEFGPFQLDYRRGRSGGGWGTGHGTVYTEQLPTEFLAAAYGPRAYREETQEVRAANPHYFISGQQYRDFNTTPTTPLMQEHLGEQLRRTLRAWRTIGATTVPIPWAFQRGWDQVWTNEPQPAFAPGQRGLWWPQSPAWKQHFLRPDGGAASPWAVGLQETLQPTLAWIAAPGDANDVAAFTAKDHSFTAGQTIRKQIALLNDTRAPQDWSLEWAATLAGAPCGGGTASGTIAQATTRSAPLELTLPAGATGAGELTLTARIGTATHRDRFAFHVFAPQPALDLPLTLWDPTGASAALVQTLGCRVSAWDGAPGTGLLVVGRSALSSGAKPPGDLAAYVRGGGRVLVLAQDPEWQRRQLGLRVGHQVLRQAFAVDPAHPLMAGLDNDDLRDWAGSSTLIADKPAVTERDLAPSGGPGYGWHWGNRGAVCSAMVEKPHLSGWRPLLEGDFDCAFTPLMELDLAAGRLTWCTLDLEDHVARDPAAAKLAANLLRHCATAPLTPRAGTVAYLGDTAGRTLLASLGTVVAEQSTLLVAGSGADPTAVAAHLARGGTVLALDAAAVGLISTPRDDLGGTPAVPSEAWCAGLSASDLHRRAPGPGRVLSAPAGTNWTIGADGQLAWRHTAGGGLVIAIATDPLQLPADRLTYLRLTRWRQARTLAQILANLGAGFAADTRIFHPASEDSLALDGTWRAKLVVPLPPTPDKPYPDPGIGSLARAALQPGFDDHAWSEVAVPGRWSMLGASWRDSDGEAVYRRTVVIPPQLAGKDLELRLGSLDDFDTACWDGTVIGSTDRSTDDWWTAQRVYRIPAAQATPGPHLLAVRLFDAFGDGGFTGRPTQQLLKIAGSTQLGWYWPDYLDTWSISDDPHRYCRW